MKLRHALFATIFLMAYPAHAATYYFSYTSTSGDGATGFGSFTTNDTGTIALADLTGFAYGEYGPFVTANIGAPPLNPAVDDVISQSLPNSFSAVVTSSGISSLSLNTSLYPAAGTTAKYTNLVFAFTSIGVGGGLTGPSAYGAITALDFGNTAAAVASTPEPATWMMMMLGFGVIGYSIRKRANAYINRARSARVNLVISSRC